MIIIKIIHCSYTKEDFERRYELKTYPDYGKNFILTNGNEFTHLLIGNGEIYKGNRILSYNNVIGFSCEPPEFASWYLDNRWLKKAKFYKYNLAPFKISSSSFTNILNFHPFTIPRVNRYKEIVPKNKLISISISDKHLTNLHKYRHELTDEILKLNLPVDIYGKGSYKKNFENDERIKGKYEMDDDVPFREYKFHICIENSIHSHYITEKLINPLFTRCVPLYLGSPLADLYFGNYIIKLNGDLKHDIEVIKKICNSPDEYLKDIDTKYVLDRINIINSFKLFA